MVDIIPNMSDSIFSKIIKHEIPAHFVYEDDICVVIMDKFPGVEGQSLVVPKKEIDYVFDLDETTYDHIFKIAKKVAKASDAGLGAKRTCLVVEGFEVPHVHIKIYPIKEGSNGLAPFLKSGGPADDGTLAELAAKIKAAF
jgi:histidine triad (HIT) family protein